MSAAPPEGVAPATSPKAPLGITRRAVAIVAAVVAALCALYIAVALVNVLKGAPGGLGYTPIRGDKPIGIGLLVVVGLAGVALVLFGGRFARASTLRTRSFVVIVVSIIIPALLLIAVGGYAFVRTWETARVLYTDQAAYAARGLGDEIRSLRLVPGGLAPAERARLGEAIVAAYASGNRGGAMTSTMKDVVRLHVLPRWAIRSLERHGFAIGTFEGASPKGPVADIVAWRVGRTDVHYFTAEYLAQLGWFDLPFSTRAGGLVVTVAVAGAGLTLALGLLGAWILSRSVVRPVRRLAVASGRLAEGEAGVTVTPEGPRELRELADSFNDMNAKLTKAQETEQAFLLSVSHELKTPLTSIRGYAEGIGDGTVQPPEGAAVIGAESSRLERLVGDLLDSGRMRKSAFTVHREAVDLATLAQDVALRYEGTARDAGLSLYLKTEARGSALADNDRVLQVVSNLVENAIRCTPSPGTVTITTAPGVVTVADTGRGLTGDDLPRAFERFYLYSRYGTDRQVGTGLGLAIVKELTEAMGGMVSVSSAVGVGTAFTVALPQDDISSTVALPQDDASAAATTAQDHAS
jgi:signal transduction histidine kinase